ncbi:MAG TPA: rhomboid family intramembrane serine protease [Candidatus Deferrimicrobium sp.]|nr:rhomboid family intramembrane serine protease [Candidatus Deferrimicrobium sp.]
MVRNPSITEWLVLSNIIMYICLAIIGFSAFTLNANVLIYIGQYNKFIFEHGYFYELFTALFVHFHIGHLLGNLIFLLLYGYRAEDFYNWKQYLVIFLLAGLIGNLLGLILGPDFLSAGASGAIFGLFGALIYPIRSEAPKTLKSMIFLGIIFLIFSGINYNVDHFSHWAGFIVGLILGKIYTQKRLIKHEAPPGKIRLKQRFER